MSSSSLSWRGIWSTLTLADRVLCTLLLVGSLALVVALAFTRGSSATAVVTVERVEVARLPLNHDAEVTVEGFLGPVTVEVRDGAVRVVASPCPEKICLATGWRQHAGDVIACVPSGLLVRLIDGSPADRDAPDAVTR